MSAMMTHVGIYENLKTGIWTKCAATATKLENVMVKPQKDKYSHDKFCGKMLDYARYLRAFGEMGVVRIIDTVK